MRVFTYLEQLSNEKENNNSSGMNDTSAESKSNTERNLKVLLYCCLFLLGTFGNFLVIFVIRGKRRKSINDFFIFNLAISDLAFLWLSLPFYTYELFSLVTKNLVYCKIVWPMMSVVLSASVFTLVSMAAERSRGILHPFKPRIQIRATLIWISVMWLSSVITILPLMIVAKSEGTTCTEDWPNESYRKLYTAVLFGIQYAVPSLVIGVVYVRIAIHLVRSRRPMRTSINSRGQVTRHKTRAENLQIIRTVAAIIVLFMACMLPNQIAWMLYDFGGDDNRELSNAFWNFAEALMYLHSCINPIVYGTLTRQFRRGYIRCIRLLFCCSKARNRGVDLTQDMTEKSKSGQSTNRNNVVNRGSIKCTSIVLNRTRSPYLQSSPDGRTFLGNVARSQIFLEEANSTELLHNVYTHGEMVFENLTFENLCVETEEEPIVQDTKL